MDTPDLLPALPLVVHVESQFAHLWRLHEWDDPGWLPKRPGTLRSYAWFHRSRENDKDSKE